MIADERLGSKYVSKVLLDLKGQGFLSWKEKSQKIENVKGIANLWRNKQNFLYMPFLYDFFSDSFIFDFLDWNFIYTSKIKTKFFQIISRFILRLKLPVLGYLYFLF